MTNYGKIMDYTTEDNKIIIQFEAQKGIVEIVSDRVIRIYEEAAGQICSKAVIRNGHSQMSFTVEREDERICISSGELRVYVTDDFMTELYDGDTVVCRDYSENRKVLKEINPEMLEFMAKEGHQFQGDGKSHKIEVVKQMDGDEFFYGLGDKTGFLNKRGYEYTMWNTDNPSPQVDSFQALYKSIPFFITLKKSCVYGIFFDNTYKSFFDMGKESDQYYWFGSDAGFLDYYLITGRDMKEIVSGYMRLTGTAPLPQLWTLGYHQSRWGYDTAEQLLDISENMKKYQIPCDALHWDIAYMDSYKVFTTDKDKVPDLAEVTERLGKNGIKLVAIIDPGVKREDGYYVYEQGKDRQYFALSGNQSVYENVVWPGISVYPDFGREEVRKWWGDLHKVLTDAGVRGIWNDMNEPAGFEGELPDKVVFYDEERRTDHAEMHNVYGHEMARATYEGLKRLDHRRPFVITRACYSGTQRYSIAWTGDNHSIWAHLQMAIPQLCNLGLSGMPIVGTDIGGFGSDATAELLIRWIQMGCFSPFCRNHAALGTRNQEPWAFDEKTLSIYREYLQIRYSLILYYYDLLHEEEKTGIPVMRPVVLNYPKDPEARELNSEFMIGDQLLAAPVTEQGARHKIVYLPEGEWFDFWTDRKLTGQMYLMREADLETCPIYAKAGSMIPGFAKCTSTDQRDRQTLILTVYEGEGEYIHYQDDGESFGYQAGIYNAYRFSQKKGVFRAEIIKAGYSEQYRVFIIEYHSEKGKKTYKFEVESYEENSTTVEGLLFEFKIS